MHGGNVVLTTTLILYERLIGGEVSTSAPTYQALPKALPDRSAEFFAKLPHSDSSATRRRRSLDYICRTVRLFTAKGGLILAGTDSYFLGSYPGDLHREMELQVACGRTPAQALAAATSNPARWLDADSIGTLEAGRLADMIILSDDPLTDIRNTSDIVFVIKSGRVHSPAQIRAHPARP